MFQKVSDSSDVCPLFPVMSLIFLDISLLFVNDETFLKE